MSLEEENKQLKEYLAEAIDIANFTVSNHGLFIKGELWALKIELSKSAIVNCGSKLDQVVKYIH
jgi:hypothetical protein